MAKTLIGNIKGKNGRGITSIKKTGTDGSVDTYTITYTDSTTSTFTVNNSDNVLLQRQIVPSAAVESSATASQAYATGDYVVVNGVLRKVTSSIMKGSMIGDSNSTATTVTGEIKAVWDSAPQNKILWSGQVYMQPSHIISLSETVDSQRNGIVLAWSGFDFVNQEAKNYDWNYVFVPKYHVDKSNDAGAGVACFLVNGDASYLGVKYVYVHNDKITGNENNNKENSTAPNSGMLLNNKRFVLRYVIGV